MLKYSIAAVALVTGATLAFAGPNDRNGGAGPGAGAGAGAQMEHSQGGGANNGSMPGRDANEGKSASPSGLKANGALDEKAAPKRNAEREVPGASKGADASGSTMRDKSSTMKSAQDRTGDRSHSADDRQAGQGAKTADQNRERPSHDEKAGADANKNSSSTGASEGTDGKSGMRSQVSVTSEQRSKLAPAFSRHRVEPARNLSVSINIGVALPRSVRVYPVPVEIIEIVPNYRGYDYVMLDDNRVAIVDPATYEIIDIIVVA